MPKEPKLLEFLKTKSNVVDNLRAMQENLSLATDEGLIDLEDLLHNQVLFLIDQATVSTAWEELEEVISKGKILEADVDTFLATHGQTSLSLPWPRIPKGK